MSLDSRIPGWMDKIQFITFYAFNPCDVPWIAYFEAAKPISGEIAIALLGFDLRQFLQAVFKPKWMRSPRHTRRGRRGKKRGGGIPEIADMLADRLDPHGYAKPDRWWLGPRMLLEWVQVTDQVAWTIFLIEAWDALIINSVVGVLEGDLNACPNIARASRSADFITFASGGGGRGPINVSHRDYAVNVDTPNGWSMTVGEGTFVCVLAGQARKVNADGYCAGAFRVQDAKGYRESTGPQVTLSGGAWVHWMDDVRITGPGSVYFDVVAGTGFVDLAFVKAFLIQIGD